MPDPDTRIDPMVEWAIEKTCQFLEPRVNYIDWEGDPDRKAIALQDTLVEIENGSSSEGAKVVVRKLIVDAMKKRSSKPTRRFRDLSLAKAARRLMNMGYNPSRNDEMHRRESGASIIQKALARLDVSMTEKQVKDIVLKYLAVLKYPLH